MGAAAAPRDRPPPCVLCRTTPAFRRGVCRTCHRKLSECGLPLPGDGTQGRRKRSFASWLRACVARWAGVDDVDPRWDWRYGQRHDEWGVEIRFGAGA